MNYLFHIYSAKFNTEDMFANFAGDFIKGNLDNQQLPLWLKNGIKNHRKIDVLSDKLYINFKKNYINKKYYRLVNIVLDIVMDYYLLKNWQFVSDINKDFFLNQSYNCLILYKKFLKEKTILNWIVREKIFHKYEDLKFVKKRIFFISKKKDYLKILPEIFNEIIQYEKELEELFYYIDYMIKYNNE